MVLMKKLTDRQIDKIFRMKQYTREQIFLSALNVVPILSDKTMKHIRRNDIVRKSMYSSRLDSIYYIWRRPNLVIYVNLRKKRKNNFINRVTKGYNHFVASQRSMSFNE